MLGQRILFNPPKNVMKEFRSVIEEHYLTWPPSVGDTVKIYGRKYGRFWEEHRIYTIFKEDCFKGVQWCGEIDPSNPIGLKDGTFIRFSEEKDEVLERKKTIWDILGEIKFFQLVEMRENSYYPHICDVNGKLWLPKLKKKQYFTGERYRLKDIATGWYCKDGNEIIEVDLDTEIISRMVSVEFDGGVWPIDTIVFSIMPYTLSLEFTCPKGWIGVID